VHEALGMAGTTGLENLRLHVDWNQASIDSDHVCREGEEPGDYVQWDPAELFYLHDWNVIVVPDGLDFRQIAAAQRLSKQAWEKIVAAQRANEWDMKGHAQKAKELLDLEESTGMFLLVFAVKQDGVQVDEQRLLGTVVCAQAVSQGVARG
jgi:transketolase